MATTNNNARRHGKCIENQLNSEPAAVSLTPLSHRADSEQKRTSGGVEGVVGSYSEQRLITLIRIIFLFTRHVMGYFHLHCCEGAVRHAILAFNDNGINAVIKRPRPFGAQLY